MIVEATQDPGTDEGMAYRALWLAVIELAFTDAFGRTSNARQGSALPDKLEQYQARQWLLSESFNEVCNLAGLNPEFVWRERHTVKRRCLERQRKDTRTKKKAGKNGQSTPEAVEA